MLKILIHYREITTQADNDPPMRVRPALVRQDNKVISVQNSKSGQDYDDVELVLLRWYWGRRINIPTELKESIRLFMFRYHLQQSTSFDCYAFANLVKNVPVHKVFHMSRYWDTEILEGMPEVGSVVFFMKGENHFMHAAIYIGDGLYVSIYGVGGHIEFSTAEAMLTDFQADNIQLATPINKSALYLN